VGAFAANGTSEQAQGAMKALTSEQWRLKAASEVPKSFGE
jgi:hypothetical protein